MADRSRQLRYQAAHRAKHLCTHCPRPAIIYRTKDGSQRVSPLCEACLAKRRERERHGVLKPWRKGGPGRPPISSGRKGKGH